jgi:uncharacterized protein (DUF58 family)
LRRRLYILPTRQGLIYTVMLAVILLGAVNYTNNMAYMLAFMLGSLFMVCMLHTYRNLRGLIINVGEARPVFAGDTAQFPVLFDNRTGHDRGSISVDVRTQRQKYIAALFRLHIRAGQMQREHLGIRATSRGYLKAGRLKIHSVFPLGLFQAWSTLDSNSRCLVYPKPEGNPLLPELIEDNTRDQSGRLNGTDDFTGVRRYHTGDSIRNVDWKAYAREQGLLVKKFSGSGSSRLILHWDQTARLVDIEARLSQMALWVIRAEQEGVQYGMLLPGVSVEMGHGENHRHLCLSQLALYGQ